MTAPPKPRWFRFGLRTMFVALTLAGMFAGWTGRQLNWIKRRHEALPGRWHTVFVSEGVDISTRAPGCLWLFGEKGVKAFLVSDTETPESLAELRRLFPEAELKKRSFW